MMNAIIVNNQIIEVSQECMNVILTVAQNMGVKNLLHNANDTSRTENTKDVAKVAKVYDHVTEGFDDFMFTVKDNKVSYTHKDGTYLHEKAIRQALNSRIKAAGGAYVDKCWEFNKGDKRDLAGAKKFVAEHSNVVTAEEINAICDKWTAQSAKRAKKATK